MSDDKIYMQFAGIYLAIVKCCIEQNYNAAVIGKVAEAILQNAERADVAPVVHGAWCGSVCSACGESSGEWYDFSYCPHCGAKMDESEDNDNE